jgi:hypothetical protein
MRMAHGLGAAVLAGSIAAAAAPDPVTIRLTDYAAAPITGSPTGSGNGGSLARINVMREEPGGRGRFFLNDLNGPLYILDTRSKAFTTYLDFNGRDEKPGLFDKLPTQAGFANGLISFQFDPDYTRNGIFYTIHLEEPAAPGSTMPDNRAVPGLRLDGYTTTAPVATPGPVEREAVVIEWTDTNTADSRFEGTARELMRVQLNTRIHPMGDLIFNPTARPGDQDWRVMYIGCGDGGSGEQAGLMRMNPQRLDTMVGKILRIVPDPTLHQDTSVVSGNGRYRVPRDNPFVTVPGARPEIWAYGLRNPHRLTWDVDPASGTNSRLLAATIGLHTWEMVFVVHKGANYGYSEREGNQRLGERNAILPLPVPDEIPVRVNESETRGMVHPTYPVIQYPHTPEGGDAIAGGFVYRGPSVPALQGKYVFGDITTGHLWWADYAEMVRADDGRPDTMAAMHPVQIRTRAAGGPEQTFPSLFPIVAAAYHARGGVDPDLPGASDVLGTGRADIRLAVDARGELFILSKVDGMIRSVTGN